jgi:Plant transposon protein
VYITGICTVKEKAFCKQQEAVRKGAERVFGVLFQQF